MSDSKAQLESRAKSGDPQGMFDLARHYLSEGNHEDAHTWMREAVKYKLPQAQYHYGVWALRGHILDQHADSGWASIRDAANAGFFEAQRTLAHAALGGYLAGEPDWDLALSWFKKAVLGGYARAVREAGMLMTLNGDLRMAETVLARAAVANDAMAQYQLGLKFIAKGGADNLALGKFWLLKAHENGHLLGMERAQDPALADVQPRNPKEADFPKLDLEELDKVLSRLRPPDAVKTKPIGDSGILRQKQGVISAEVSDYLIAAAHQHFGPPGDVFGPLGFINPGDRGSGQLASHIPSMGDLVAIYVGLMMDVSVGLNSVFGTETTILKLNAREGFGMHRPYVDPESVGAKDIMGTFGQTLRVGYIRLSSHKSGGTLVFPKLDTEIPAVAGDMVLVDPNAGGEIPDARSVHRIVPAEEPQWILVKWYRTLPPAREFMLDDTWRSLRAQLTNA